MRRSVRVLGALAVVVAVLAVGACGSEGNQSATVSTADVGEYASWWLNSAPSSVSTDLELTVQHGMCDEVGTAQIQESETAVVVDIPTPWTGKVGPNGEKGCSGAARLVRMTVHLDAPLADRLLLGCRHDEQPCQTVFGV